ncbi:MAG: ATP-dependent Clp protease ATP-binding subunit, partial [Oscillospiraceae bacterium]
KEMCRTAVTMSERYITDRFLPDKAIDLIDEACSDVNLKNPDIERVFVIEKDMADLDKERELLLADNDGDNFERLAAIRSQSLQLSDELTKLKANGKPALTTDNLARVIELWTKIPASSIREDEYERLADLHLRLKKNIIGQDTAVDAVCSAIKRNRVGLAAKHKPVSFIFVGSTGVGKTELVKRLSEDLFNSPESLIRIDMSEFMEKHSVSRIIGSPPGYVGYDEGGQLTEKVRRKPYCVILFDEIEKAHEDVFNIMLQIMDDGRLTDSQGRHVDFKNTIIVMTSNIGAKNITKNQSSLGFSSHETKTDGIRDIEEIRALVMKDLRDTFRPEFLNRIDDTIVFHQLSRDNIKQIASNMLEIVSKRLEGLGISLQITDEVVSKLAQDGFDPVYGARPLRRVIQSVIEDAAAEKMLDGTLKDGDTAQADVEDSKIVLKKAV